MTSPLYLHPSDNPNLNVTQIVFDGSNYDMWAEAVKNGLDAKNKLAFIEGKVKKPESDGDEETLELVSWRQCNAMLRAWLRNVIDPKLYASITFSQPIADVWEELRGRYAAGNAPRVHQLKNELNDCKQGRGSVVEYDTRLKTIWDELANYSKVKDCSCGAVASIVKEREEEKVHQFSMGLDSKLYGNIRTNLLMEDPIATLTRAYALILREERHASLTKVKEERNDAAMAVKNYGVGRGKGAHYKAENDETDGPPQCTHCGKYYHIEENCYDKHGYEEVKARERGRGRRGSSSSRGSGRGRGRSRSNYQANAASFRMGQATNQETHRNRIGASHHMTGRREYLEKTWVEDSSTDRTTRMQIGRGEHRQGVYYYQPDKAELVRQVAVSRESQLWHKRLGHPSKISNDTATPQHGFPTGFERNCGGDIFIDYDISLTPTHVERGSDDLVEAGNETEVGIGDSEISDTNETGKWKRTAFLATINKEHEPSNYAEAAKDRRWREAMSKEIEALETNGTWKIVTLPKGKKPIGCKWVYKIKYLADGKVERYKARLVAQGFTQVEGVDFYETYAPVAKMTSVRCMLAVAVIKGWFIEQLDVNNAFLHEDLNEELLGIGWQNYRFVQSMAEYSLFMLNRDGIFIAVLVYVDDMIVASNDKEACKHFKYFLNKSFGIKDLGRLRYFLGIEVAHGSNGLFLNQQKYAMNIIEEAGMKGAKTAYTPIQPRHNLGLANGYVLKDINQRLVGSQFKYDIYQSELLGGISNNLKPCPMSNSSNMVAGDCWKFGNNVAVKHKNMQSEFDDIVASDVFDEREIKELYNLGIY
ncbi:uncharacterized protein LOC141612955 [Silene latifolia]|uniref:uncharacterized protein LOC141612955 n=1 Tax=Silene latifolia TaxID=37657 RepID=UPI003D771BDD